MNIKTRAKNYVKEHKDVLANVAIVGTIATGICLVAYGKYVDGRQVVAADLLTSTAGERAILVHQRNGTQTFLGERK